MTKLKIKRGCGVLLVKDDGYTISGSKVVENNMFPQRYVPAACDHSSRIRILIS